MATTTWAESLRPRRVSIIFATLALFILMIIGFQFYLQYSDKYASMESNDKFNSTTSVSASHRKLLQQKEAAKGVEVPNRIWGDRSCSSSDIVISQGPTDPLPNGIPTYTVEITNVCVTGCSISAIHVHCGWFSSARLINPRIFKRLRYDDCLVNNGKPLLNGLAISFQYANTFPYQLSVSSIKC